MISIVTNDLHHGLILLIVFNFKNVVFIVLKELSSPQDVIILP